MVDKFTRYEKIPLCEKSNTYKQDGEMKRTSITCGILSILLLLFTLILVIFSFTSFKSDSSWEAPWNSTEARTIGINVFHNVNQRT